MRYCSPAQAPAGAVQLFGEMLTPVVSRSLGEQIGPARRRRWRRPTDLAQHTLAEEDDTKTSTEYLSWRRWLPARARPGSSRSAGCTSTSPTSRCRRRSPATASRWPGVRAGVRGPAARRAGRAVRLGRGASAARISYWMIVAPASRGPRPEVAQVRSAGSIARRRRRDARSPRSARPPAAGAGASRRYETTPASVTISVSGSSCGSGVEAWPSSISLNDQATPTAVTSGFAASQRSK